MNKRAASRLSSLSDNGDRTMKKIILAAAFVLTATPAAFAQFAYGPGYRYYDAAPGYGYYDAAPGYSYYGAAPDYGYQGYYGSGPRWVRHNSGRGGPRPRAWPGS